MRRNQMRWRAVVAMLSLLSFSIMHFNAIGQRPGGGSPGQSGGRPGPSPGGRPGGSTRPVPSPGQGGNRPSPGRPSPGGSRPSPGRPSPGRPSPGRPPQGGNRPSPGRPSPGFNRPRPNYNFGDGGNGWRLRRYFNNDMSRLNRARRHHFLVGGYFPQTYITYLQPIPPDVMGYLPPVPDGYAMGYYDGYTVVYDPATRLILNVLDLFRY